MFILIMIETTSRGSFDHEQAKYVENGGLCGGKASAQKIQNWPYCETTCLVEIWEDEKV